MSTDKQKRRGISIFRAADETPLLDTDFMSMPILSEETGKAWAEFPEGAMENSGFSAILLRQSKDEGGFSLLRVWFKAHFPVFRHTHDGDCLYYVLAGSVTMGNQTLRVGDGFFVPSNAPYQYVAGPDGVEVLEIRHNVDNFELRVQDADGDYWKQFKETLEANTERWATETTSPMTAANRSS